MGQLLKIKNMFLAIIVLIQRLPGFIVKVSLVVLYLSLFCNYSFAQEVITSSEKTFNEIEVIETIGKRPGPPLWKVSNGSNVVWIFGIPSPYSREDLDWDRTSVNAIMSESQLFIPAPEMIFPANPFKLIAITKVVAGMTYMPDDGYLEDVISEELYQRFLDAKAIYIPKKDNILKYRPHYAGIQLYSSAMRNAGLVTSLQSAER